MTRKAVRLTVETFEAVADPGAASLFWELDPVRRARVPRDQAASVKREWIQGVQRDWGPCGRVVTVDDLPVGYALYAPAAFVPGSAAFPTAPVSADAVVLTRLWVSPEQRGGGLGRMLVQSMAKDLVERRACAAVEAFGAVRRSDQVLPEGFLSSVGFITQRAHPNSPRMRMELRSAVKLRDEVEQALERLARLLKPAKGAAGEVSRSLGSVHSAERSSDALRRST